MITFFIYISVYPQITKFSTNSSFKVGDSLTILCVARGYPYINMRLLHNGTILQQISNSSKYTGSVRWRVEKLTLNNSGDYACAVDNSLGGYRRNISVTLKGMEKVSANFM